MEQRIDRLTATYVDLAVNVAGAFWIRGRDARTPAQDAVARGAARAD